MKIPRPKDPIDVGEAKRLLDSGLTLVGIGQRLGYRAASVARALRVAGVKIQRRRSPIKTEADRRLQITWRSIVARCTRPRDPLYARYGARGVRICGAWHDFVVFRDWARAHGWKPGLSLGLDVWEFGYAPGNCTWVSRSESIQQGILDGPKGALWGITAFGETKTASAWADDRRCTVGAQGLLERLERGLDPERAITLPQFAERRITGSRRSRPARKGSGRHPSRAIDWDKVRELYVKKGLDVAETALALDASYHGVLRGLRQRGWLIEHETVPWTKLQHGRHLHRAWLSMRERCRSPAHPEYAKVGGRGIRTCTEWEDFGAFHAWALRSGYRPGLCLARLDRARDYAPSNCRWLTRQEMSNRILPKISRKTRWTFTAFGETKGPTAWSRDRRCAVSLTGLVDRLRGGWKPEEAIVTPSKTGPEEPLVWVTAFGESKGVEDWVRDRRCRVGPSSLRKRLREGVPAELAITAPPFRVPVKKGRTERGGGR